MHSPQCPQTMITKVFLASSVKRREFVSWQENDLNLLMSALVYDSQSICVHLIHFMSFLLAVSTETTGRPPLYG